MALEGTEFDTERVSRHGLGQGCHGRVLEPSKGDESLSSPAVL